MSTNHIFGKPEYLDLIGYVHPIKLKNYDDFIECSNYLYISKNHFTEEADNYPLLDLIMMTFRDDKPDDSFTKLFSLVLQTEVKFVVNSNSEIEFITANQGVINSGNYELLRQTVMRQNLMFEQKVYKDKVVQAYMHKVFETRAKNSIKMEFEDKISTVSVFSGKHYWDLEKYTIYQLEMDFYRIAKIKSYDTSVSARVAGSDTKIEHFAENVDLFKNPYDLNNFTKSKDSVQKLDTNTK